MDKKNSNRSFWIILLLQVVLTALLAACRVISYTSRIEVGTSQSKVIKLLGDPDEINVIEKQTEIIWGPEESWWDTLEMGDKIEIWVYHYPEGTYQVYFLNESDQVDFEAFLEKGAVY
jgi:hypothetical protein